MSLDLEAGLKEMKGQLVTEEDLLQSTEGLHAQLKDAKEQTRDALDRQTEEVRDQLLKLEAATNDRFRVEADASRERLVMVSGELAEKIGSVAMAVKQDMSSLRDSVRTEIEDAQGDLKGRVQDVEVLVLQEKADREEQLGRLQDKHEMRLEGLEDQLGALDTSLEENAAACEDKIQRMKEQTGQEMSDAKAHFSGRLSSSSRALHLLQKLMSRPDGAELFVEFDIDGDGTVSREELKLGYAKLGEDLSEDDLDAIMSLVDRDGDGEMDYNEFVQMGKMTEDVKALRMSMDENLEQLKRESEETMETKIKPLESRVGELEDDLGRQLETLRDDLGGTLQLSVRAHVHVSQS